MKGMEYSILLDTRISIDDESSRPSEEMFVNTPFYNMSFIYKICKR